MPTITTLRFMAAITLAFAHAYQVICLVRRILAVRLKKKFHLPSGDRNLVVVNVHFEPDLTLRSLRERLRLRTPHWPLFTEVLGG